MPPWTQPDRLPSLFQSSQRRWIKCRHRSRAWASWTLWKLVRTAAHFRSQYQIDASFGSPRPLVSISSNACDAQARPHLSLLSLASQGIWSSTWSLLCLYLSSLKSSLMPWAAKRSFWARTSIGCRGGATLNAKLSTKWLKISGARPTAQTKINATMCLSSLSNFILITSKLSLRRQLLLWYVHIKYEGIRVRAYPLCDCPPTPSYSCTKFPDIHFVELNHLFIFSMMDWLLQLAT